MENVALNNSDMANNEEEKLSQSMEINHITEQLAIKIHLLVTRANRPEAIAFLLQR